MIHQTNSKLDFTVYKSKGFYWFELIVLEKTPLGWRPAEFLFRRRYETKAEAQECAQQAFEATLQKRRDAQEKRAAVAEFFNSLPGIPGIEAASEA